MVLSDSYAIQADSRGVLEDFGDFAEEDPGEEEKSKYRQKYIG